MNAEIIINSEWLVVFLYNNHYSKLWLICYFSSQILLLKSDTTKVFRKIWERNNWLKWKRERYDCLLLK